MTTLHNQQLYARALRRACGMSQIQLSEALGHTQSTISRWERVGAIPAVSLAALEDLAKRMEKRQLHKLPSLRVAAAELAARVLDGKSTYADLIPLAERVLAVLEGQK